MGFAAGAVCWFLWHLWMHEYHDPPLSEELARNWKGGLFFSTATGLFGYLFGALLGEWLDADP